MPSLVVSCHGGRGAGTSKGTYVVPKGVKIYFFTDDTVILSEGQSWTDDAGDRQSSGATWLEDLLLTTAPDELTVQKYATEVKKQFETIPNYVASGAADDDPNFTYPTGLYWVGADPNNGPCFRVPHGREYRLSQIIGGAGSGGVISTTIYWLCCRYSPRNSNNTSVVGDKGTFGYDDQAAGMGLKPSQVAALGGHWR